MFAALIITLRETLEASLIVGIILAYLKKTENQKHNRVVWFGVLAGILVSVLLAVVFEKYLGGFTGRAEELYEGIVMFVAAGLLTWMILWMLGQRRHLKKNIEGKVHSHIENDNPLGLFLLAFVGVAREGIETVIFFQAISVQSDGAVIFGGGMLGIVIAVLLAYLLFKGIAKIPLRQFFTVTSILLILFAAGLVAHGVHELQEAGVVPIINEHLWDINGLLDENSAIGGILKGLFGYNGNPSLIEALSYLGYLVLIGAGWMFKSRTSDL